MTETQEYLLELFKELDAICKKYDIEYYLGGGSLIGAVRHSGFLPWDDDADIHMSRENAEKFAWAVKEEGLKNRVVYVKSPNGDYMNSHWRYENTASTLLMRGLTGSSGAQGQFIDIFVLYPLPVDEKKKEKCIENFDMFVELKAQNAVAESHRDRKYLKRYFRAKRLEKIIGKKRLINRLEKKMYNFPQEGSKDWFICAPFPPKRVVPKDWWGKPRYVKFESIMLPVPEYAERILSYEYGPNWFEVPSYTERGEHTFVTDFDIPYEVYTAEYNKYLDINNFYKHQVKKKEYWMRLLKKRNVINPQIRTLQGMCTFMEIQRGIDEYGFDLKELVQQGREQELKMLFQKYFTMMKSNSFRYWGIYIDMPDEYLYAALYFNCFDGKYGLARKILRAREKNRADAMSEELKSLYDICNATDELLENLYGNGDLNIVRQLIDKWLKDYPKLLYFMRAKMYLDLMDFEQSKYEQLMKQCKEYLAQYHNDGELLKYQGDLYLKANQIEKAELCYKKALCRLKNGFAIADIKRYFEQSSGGKDETATAKNV